MSIYTIAAGRSAAWIAKNLRAPDEQGGWVTKVAAKLVETGYGDWNFVDYKLDNHSLWKLPSGEFKYADKNGKVSVQLVPARHPAETISGPGIPCRQQRMFHTVKHLDAQENSQPYTAPHIL